MATKKNKTYKVDFYVLTVDQKQGSKIFKRLLENSVAAGCTEALALLPDDDENFQIRSLISLGGGAIYKGVFGRCRYNETPVQGTKDGSEEDVALKPGHGLVEKNYFLYDAGRNLIVYQRNSSGSHYTKLQAYLELATDTSGVTLEPLLTSDSYAKLLSSKADVKRVELSFQKPKHPSLYPHEWTQSAMHVLNSAGSVNSKLTLSVGRAGGSLTKDLKNAAVTLAKDGLATVARVRLDGELEPIDLIASRVIETATVSLSDKGRPDPDEIYAALDRAKTKRKADLDAFFGT